MNDEALPQLGHAGRIIEGIVTTHNADGSLNVSPMGPIVDEDFSTLVLRPFQTSTTYRNLKRTGVGVFHVTDDVALIARSAIGNLPAPVSTGPALEIEGTLLTDACRAYEFCMHSLDDREERTCIVGQTVARHRMRDFLGFNRAKHAVIEAAILATRIHLLPASEIQGEFERLETIVHKTGGSEELAAFAILQSYLASQTELASCEREA